MRKFMFFEQRGARNFAQTLREFGIDARAYKKQVISQEELTPGMLRRMSIIAGAAPAYTEPE